MREAQPKLGSLCLALVLTELARQYKDDQAQPHFLHQEWRSDQLGNMSEGTKLAR